MYEALLWLHSWFRWLVLLAGLFATARAIEGLATKRAWTKTDRVAGLSYTGLLDVQLLLGLVLYVFLSPMTTAAFADFGTAMKSAPLRFWAVEHSLLMVLGIVLAHVGQIRLRKLPEAARLKSALLWFGLSWVAVVAAVPWPVRELIARPWFRV